MNLGVAAFRNEGRVPRITRGDNHDDAALDEAIHLNAKGALPTAEPARVEVIAEAHVDAVNRASRVDRQPFTVLVPRLNLINGLEDPTHLALARGLLAFDTSIGDDLEADEFSRGSNSRNRAQTFPLLDGFAAFRLFVSVLASRDPAAGRIGRFPVTGNNSRNMRAVPQSITQ